MECEIFGINAKALLRGKLKIPDDRLKQMYNDFIKECKVVLSDRILRSEDHSTLKQVLQEAEENPSEINYNFVERSLKLKSKKTSTTAQKRQNIHGKVLIEKFGGEERLPEFIKIWRQLFLDEMKPKFLPKNWSVDHWIIRKFGNNSKFYYDEDTKDYK